MKVINNCKTVNRMPLGEIYRRCKDYKLSGFKNKSLLSLKKAIVLYCSYKLLGGKRELKIGYVQGFTEMAEICLLIVGRLQDKKVLGTLDEEHFNALQIMYYYAISKGINISTPSTVVKDNWNTTTVLWFTNKVGFEFKDELRYNINVAENGKYSFKELYKAILKEINHIVSGNNAEFLHFVTIMTSVHADFWNNITFKE